MIESFKYVNHMNEEITFGDGVIFANYNDLRDYSWGHSSANEKITAFRMGIVNKSIPAFIKCKTEEEGLLLKNRLHEIIDKDVLALNHGRLIIGDYYLRCYITGSQKTNYLIQKEYLEFTLEITTDYPQWVRESCTSFNPAAGETTTGKRNLDFNYDFPFDYSSEMKNRKLINTGFIDTNFRLIVYGPCINPEIHIAGHTYQVDCEISEGEYLTIDSLTKKITLTRYNGEQVNKFNARNRESYIFKKIPAGENIVTWSYQFGFDVILFDERGEPKWI